MNEFSPLEKGKIDNKLPKKIITESFNPDDLNQGDYLDIPIREGSQEDLNNQNTELESLFENKEGQVHTAGAIKEKIAQLDRQIDNFEMERFENEVDAFHRLEKLIKKRDYEKKKLRNILGNN